MTFYPNQGQAKALAKYISNILKIRFSYAKEVVSFMYGCSNFNVLTEKSDTAIPDEQDKCIVFCPKRNIAILDKYLEPHLNSIRAHIRPSVHVKNSVLSKIASNQSHLVTYDVTQQMLHNDDQVDWSDSASVISHLEFLDDSISAALFRQAQKNTPDCIINPWINDTTFGVNVYGYYKFKNKAIDIVIREFDFAFTHPSDRIDLETRHWFSDYVIGYLSYMASQLKNLGYKGTIRLCRVNSLSGCDIRKRVKSKYSIRDKGQSKVFSQLLSIGGKWAWDEMESGEEVFSGIELSLQTLANRGLYDD